MGDIIILCIGSSSLEWEDRVEEYVREGSQRGGMQGVQGVFKEYDYASWGLLCCGREHPEETVQNILYK